MEKDLALLVLFLLLQVSGCLLRCLFLPPLSAFGCDDDESEFERYSQLLD